MTDTLTPPGASPLLTGTTAVEECLRPLLTGTEPALDLVVCAGGYAGQMGDLLGSVGEAAERLRPGLRPILLVPPSGGPAQPAGWGRMSLDAPDQWIRLESAVHEAGVLVPRVCLRRTAWLTVTTWGPHPRFGLRTPFTVHLDLMAIANPDVPWSLLACDVYRFWQPDLAIVCLPQAGAAPAAMALALADERIDRLEASLASLAGITTADLPYWCEVAARFRLADAVSPVLPRGVAVALPVPDLSRPRAAARRAVRLQAVRRRLADVRLSFVNLRRAPDFLRRRVTAARSA